MFSNPHVDEQVFHSVVSAIRMRLQVRIYFQGDAS